VERIGGQGETRNSPVKGQAPGIGGPVGTESGAEKRGSSRPTRRGEEITAEEGGPNKKRSSNPGSGGMGWQKTTKI